MAVKSGMAGSNGSGAQVKQKPKSLENILEMAEQQSTGIQDRMTAASEQMERMNSLTSEFEKALARGDIKKLEIIGSDLQTAKDNYQTLSSKIATAMFKMSDELKDVGQVVKHLRDLTAEEQGLIDTATAKEGEAKARLDTAEATLAAAYQKTTFAGIQKRAVANATAVRDAAKTEHETLVLAVEQAKDLAEEKRRIRQEGQQINESIQNINVVSDTAVQNARARLVEIGQNLESVQKTSKAASAKLEALAALQADLGEQLKAAQAEAENLQKQRDEETVKNSPEWAKLDTKLTEKMRDIRNLESKNNQAFTLYQDIQRFLPVFTAQEEGQMASQEFHQAWIALHVEGNKNRAVAYKSYVGRVAASDDERALRLSDQLLTTIDEDITKNTVELNAASRTTFLKRMQEGPEKTARLTAIVDADTQSHDQFVQGVNDLLKLYSRTVGEGLAEHNEQPAAQ